MATADGDAVELRHLDTGTSATRVLLLHGLEGSARSHYVGGVLRRAQQRGWGATLLLFRGCGDVPNVAPRFYHSGETSDLELVFGTLARRWPETRWLLAGVSLGGNVLLKWLGERAHPATERIAAAAALSVPYDLEAGARAISTGFARIYDRTFLRSLRKKALRKLARFPALFDREQLERSRSVFDFDGAVTAPVHGFESARDYYTRSSSLQFLPSVGVRTLLLAAEDDPFVPVSVLRQVELVVARNANIHLEVHPHGGHVGFVGGSPWRPTYYAEDRVFEFFDEAMEPVRG